MLVPVDLASLGWLSDAACPALTCTQTILLAFVIEERCGPGLPFARRRP